MRFEGGLRYLVLYCGARIVSRLVYPILVTLVVILLFLLPILFRIRGIEWPPDQKFWSEVAPNLLADSIVAIVIFATVDNWQRCQERRLEKQQAVAKQRRNREHMIMMLVSINETVKRNMKYAESITFSLTRGKIPARFNFGIDALHDITLMKEIISLSPDLRITINRYIRALHELVNEIETFQTQGFEQTRAQDFMDHLTKLQTASHIVLNFVRIDAETLKVHMQ